MMLHGMANFGIGTLVRRTRSSRSGCGELFREIRVQKAHYNHMLPSVPLIPKFAPDDAARYGELQNRDTSAPNPKFAQRLRRTLSRNSGSKGALQSYAS